MYLQMPRAPVTNDISVVFTTVFTFHSSLFNLAFNMLSEFIVIFFYLNFWGPPITNFYAVKE